MFCPRIILPHLWQNRTQESINFSSNLFKHSMKLSLSVIIILEEEGEDCRDRKILLLISSSSS